MKYVLLLLGAVTLLFTSGCFFPGGRGDRDGRDYRGHDDHGDHGGDHGGDHDGGDHH